MQTVSMLEFRKHAETILTRVRKGQRLVLTHRGRPVARLEPLRHTLPDPDDPAYRLYELADSRGESLTNEEIDRTVYGS